MAAKTGKTSGARRAQPATTDTDPNDVVYRELYRAIVERYLAPGMPLREEALAGAFGVSRTKIREALFRLAKDDLVTIARNKGASVVLPTLAEAKAVFTARRIVEAGIAARLAHDPNPGLIATLKACAAEEQRQWEARDYHGARETAREFHLHLAAALDNEPLRTFMHGLSARSSLAFAAYERGGLPNCRSGEHARLIELIEAGDAAAAATCMDAHIAKLADDLDGAAQAEANTGVYLRSVLRPTAAPAKNKRSAVGKKR